MGKHITEINDKAVRLIEPKAVRLVKQRALRENRSASNAAAVTIIEALGKLENKKKHNN